MCRQLGYPGAVRVASYESDSSQIWLDDVQCTGNETSIDQCSHNGFNIYDCNFDTDQVGIECAGKFYFYLLYLVIHTYVYNIMHNYTFIMLCMLSTPLYLINACINNTEQSY